MKTPSRYEAVLAAALAAAVPTASCSDTQPSQVPAHTCCVDLKNLKKENENNKKAIRIFIFSLLKSLGKEPQERAVSDSMDPNGTTACIDMDRLTKDAKNKIDELTMLSNVVGLRDVRPGRSNISKSKNDNESEKEIDYVELDKAINRVVRKMICNGIISREEGKCIYSDRKRIKLLICTTLARDNDSEIVLNGYDTKKKKAQYGLGKALKIGVLKSETELKKLNGLDGLVALFLYANIKFSESKK